MKLIEKFELGEIFEIQVGNEFVRTKLQEVLSDKEFIVLQPTINGIPIRSEDNEFSFMFRRSNGCITFRGRMLSSYKEDGVALSRVLQVSEMHRSQRRQFFRLPIILDIVVETEPKEDEEPKRAKGKTINISENSVEFSSFQGLEKGARVIATIRLAESQTMVVSANVLRSTREKKTDPFSIVLVFVEQSESERRELRRFVFRQQAQMLKKR